MARTLTPKQAAFALAYVALGQASEAYRQVYDVARMKPETIWKRSCELVAHPAVQAKLQELREQMDQHFVISRVGHYRSLELIRDRAMEAGDYSAAVRAEVKRGECAGYYREDVPPPVEAPTGVGIHGSNVILLPGTVATPEEWERQARAWNEAQRGKASVPRMPWERDEAKDDDEKTRH